MSECNKTVCYPLIKRMNDEESRKGYGHVLKYTGIFGGVQGLNILIGLVRNKLVAVILGPATIQTSIPMTAVSKAHARMMRI